MLLFPQDETVIDNYNCKVTYNAGFLSIQYADDLFNYLLKNINWKHDQAVIYGKKIITKRKIAWFASLDFNYNYSGNDRIAEPWDEEILKIKKILEVATNHTFNSCLLNLYHDGQEGMAFHSDDQNHLEKDTPVAIISLGAERFFKLRETKNKKVQNKLLLEKGSLLLMLGQTQVVYQHEIPKMLGIKTPRISLTWRTMK